MDYCPPDGILSKKRIGLTLADTENILVIKTGALGDFIQALGPMRAVRTHHKNARITLLTTEPFLGLGRACGYFDDLMIDPRPKWLDVKSWLDWRARLRSGGFARVYDLQNNDRTTFYLHLFGCRKPEWVGAAWGASHRNASKTRSAGQAFDGHVQTLALAGITGIALDDMSWVAGNADAFNLKKPYVLLVPGSAPQHPEKRWPAERYGALARLLDGRGLHPVIIGTAADADAAAAICRVFPGAVNLAGKTSLLDIVLLARKAAGAFGNDTGPMHMIAATGCPVWVFFSGVTNPLRHAPKGPAVKIIRKNDLDDLVLDEVAAELKPDNFRIS
jgi:ADP-heptose:LPS heptosyltransferase